MKKFVAFICSLAVVFTALSVFDYSEESAISKKYYDSVGNILSAEKYKSISLQEQALKRKDNVLIFGSSELTKIHNPFRPIKFFENKKDGFQINSIGDAGYKTIIHAINFGALADKLRGHKIVFVISPQWFDKSGIAFDTFHANYSEEMFYAFMFNDKLGDSIKKRLARTLLRVTDCRAGRKPAFDKKASDQPITDNIRKLGQYYKALRGRRHKDLRALRLPHVKNPDSDDLKLVNLYCKLYTGKSILSKGEFALLRPYFYMRYQALNIKNAIKALTFLQTDNTQLNREKYIEPKKHRFNWKKLLKAAEKHGDKYAYNNPFGMDNSIYNRNLKGLMQYFKGIYRNLSYTDSPEYEDFKLLLDICKSNGIRPLFINVPVNAKWYDYCGFTKQHREAYYNKIRKIIKPYGFKVADFTDHEYERYFLKDGSHLGYKGWVYVNEAIDKYYHNKF